MRFFEFRPCWVAQGRKLGSQYLSHIAKQGCALHSPCLIVQFVLLGNGASGLNGLEDVLGRCRVLVGNLGVLVGQIQEVLVTGLLIACNQSLCVVGAGDAFLNEVIYKAERLAHYVHPLSRKRTRQVYTLEVDRAREK